MQYLPQVQKLSCNSPKLSRPSRHAHDKRDKENYQENKKQNLGDPRASRGDARETEDRGNDRDQEKRKCPIQHFRLPQIVSVAGDPNFLIACGKARTLPCVVQQYLSDLQAIESQREGGRNACVT
jgi:hypothetical protein